MSNKSWSLANYGEFGKKSSGA